MKVVRHVEASGTELQDRAEFFWHASSLVLVVADGAGGLSGGAEAAEYTVRRVKERLSLPEIDPLPLERVLDEIDRDAAIAGSYGETTCVLVAVSKTGVIGASVGDSGALFISKSGVDNLTCNQHRKPFIGSGRATPVSFSRTSLDGTLLVASDGLLKYTSVDQIAATVCDSDLEEALRNLVRLVRYPSGHLPDDLSILLVRET